jgi:hypothetical protein
MTTDVAVSTVVHPRTWSLRVVVTRLADHIHASAEADALALGFTVRRISGPLGWSSREYRHPLMDRRT